MAGKKRKGTKTTARKKKTKAAIRTRSMRKKAVRKKSPKKKVAKKRTAQRKTTKKTLSAAMEHGGTSVPTYMGDVRYFFDDVDIAHMGMLGVDLSTYEGVKSKAASIFFQTQPPNASMPPGADRKWSVERSEMFKQWIRAGFPRGVARRRVDVDIESPAEASERIRKDIRELSQEELQKLKKAFSGIMARDPDELNSYFAQAAKHWLPAPTFCLHHENRYNPWHRVYLEQFEDALRSIRGCAAVTLPYWDITGPFPAVLRQPPFDSYTLPKRIGPGFDAGYQTRRNSVQQIAAGIASFGIADQIERAMGQSEWERFTSFGPDGIEGAHDSGHVACGPTMSTPDAAAFDPLFWFFHSNWDRLWWKWQRAVDATTLAKFRSTVTGPTDWLDDPFFSALPPFESTADQTIEFPKIAYVHPRTEMPTEMAALQHASIGADRAFSVKRAQQVSVRVKGINRLNIPGSFVVHLRVDGETIARRGFFQSLSPKECSNCREKGVVNIDFIQQLKDIRNRQLSVGIALTREDRIGDWFPLSVCGEPTINVRLLLEEH